MYSDIVKDFLSSHSDHLTEKPNVIAHKIVILIIKTSLKEPRKLNCK